MRLGEQVHEMQDEQVAVVLRMHCRARSSIVLRRLIRLVCYLAFEEERL